MTNISNNVDPRALQGLAVPIVLLDGRTVSLIFDLEAIAQIEDDFGSLGAMQDMLREIESEQAKAKFFRPILTMIRAALSHDPTATRAQFDPRRVGEYFVAIMEAVNRSFPKDQSAPTTQPTTPTPAPNPATTTDFPGAPSTTPSPFGLSEPMTGSGE